MQIVEKIILTTQEREAFDIVEQTLTEVQKETTDESLAGEIEDALSFIFNFLDDHTMEE